MLKSENGQWVSNKQELKNMVRDFYIQLYTMEARLLWYFCMEIFFAKSCWY